MYSKTRLKALLVAFLVGGSAALAPSAYAVSDTMLNLLSILRDKGSITQDEYNALVSAAQSEDKDAKKAHEKEMAEVKSASGGWWNDTKISGRMYYDFTWNENKRSGVRQSSSGAGFDIKRFYVGIDHKFNDTFSGNITTDFTYDSTVGATQVYIKKAYLDWKINPAFDLRFGSTDLPWVPFVEGLYGYRYVENVLIDRTKFGTSADWGVHAKGKLGIFDYGLAVVNGAGYKHPGVHSDTVDFEGRVSTKFNNFVVGVGGYAGKLGKNTEGAFTPHTATRLDAIVAYVNQNVRFGVEYFYANDWMTVGSSTSDKAEGVMVFGSYKFNPLWTVFARYDYVKPNKDTNSHLDDNYFNVGITYSPAKIVDFSLVYKHDHAGDGFLKTGNGTIGGLTATDSGNYDEFGLFGRWRW